MILVDLFLPSKFRLRFYRLSLKQQKSMKKTIISTCILLVSFIFSSCDPETCGTVFIHNESSKSIYLAIDSMQIDTVVAGQTMTVGPMCGLREGQQPNLVHFYRTVYNEDTLCNKDIRNNELWSTFKTANFKWEHHFKVNDTNF